MQYRGYELKPHYVPAGHQFGYDVFDADSYTGLWGVSIESLKVIIDAWLMVGGHEKYTELYFANALTPAVTGHLARLPL